MDLNDHKTGSVRVLFVKKKGSKNKKNKSDNFKGVASNAGNHCCECVNVMTLYLKEVCKLIFCVGPPPNSEADTECKFGAMFVDMVDLTFGLLKDFLNFVRILILCSTEKSK